MDIKQIVREYTLAKCKISGMAYKDTINLTECMFDIYTNNGLQIKLDMHPENIGIQKEFPEALPDKNGIFHVYTIQFLNIPDTAVINKNVENKMFDYYNMLCADDLTEGELNDLIQKNGGLDTDKHKTLLLNIEKGVVSND